MLFYKNYSTIGLSRTRIGQESTPSSEDISLRKYLRESVTLGTAQNYEPGIRKWKDYIKTISSVGGANEFLQNSNSDHDKAKRLVHYMAYLYMEHGLRDDQIKRAVTSVAYHFSVNGEPTTFFGLAIVDRARAAGVRTLAEKVEYEEQRAKKAILPVCMDIIMKVREQYWMTKSWDTKGTDSKAIWLAIALGFDSGPRIGNLPLKDG